MLISNYLKWAEGAQEPFLRIQNFRIRRASDTGPSSGTTIFFCCHDLHAQRKNFASDWSTRPIRLPGEFLHQGGVFDAYGNKSVSNRQWNLELEGDQNSILNPDGLEYVGSYTSTGWKTRLLGGVQPVSGLWTDGLTTPAAFGHVDTVEYTDAPASPYDPPGETTYTRYYAVKCLDDAQGEETFALISLSVGCYSRWQMWDERYTMRIRKWVGFHTTTANSYKELVPVKTTYTTVSKRFCERFNSDAEYRIQYAMDQTLPVCPNIDRVGVRPYLVANKWGDLSGTTLPGLDYEQLYINFNNKAAQVEYQFTDYDRSDVCQEIMDAINHFKGNMIAYVKDLPSLGSSITSVLDLVKDYKNPKQWASAFLSMRFGDRLTIADTSELLAAVREDVKLANRELVVYRAGKTQIDSGKNAEFSWKTKSQLTATVALSGGLLGDMENLLAAPFRWDLLPTLENVWDLVPFSFVVDWFYDVQSILNLLDQVEEVQLLDVKTQYHSIRRETTIPLRDLGVDLDGQLTRICYDRSPAEVTRWLRLRAFDDYWQSSVRPVNYLDGAALLVQSR